MFEKSFTEITLKMTGIALKRKEPFQEFANPECTLVVRTRGNFRAVITVDFEMKLIKKITQNILKKGDMLSEQERIFYLEEYLNIICGRAVSEINNLTGQHSRISVVVLQEEERKEPFGQTLKMSYTCSEGDFNIIISYEKHEQDFKEE